MGLFNNIIERKPDGSSTIYNYDIILSEYARKKDLANYLHNGRNKPNILHSDIDMGNNKITNLGNPGIANDAVSKSCKVATGGWRQGTNDNESRYGRV